MAPGEAAPPPAYATNHLEPRGSKPNTWLITLLAALLVISLIALGIIAYTRNTTTTPQPPSVTVPDAPRTGAPEIPQPPPPPTNGTGANPISRAFIYPGAETLMDMRRSNEASLLQLRTTDPYQKVLDWYVAKLKPENVIKTSDSNAILKSAKLVAIINSSGNETIIMLKGLDEDDIDLDQ
jgi:hypothetical protein